MPGLVNPPDRSVPVRLRGNGATIQRRLQPVIYRFEARYMPEPNSGCFLWLGKPLTAEVGYGRFGVGQEIDYAHRIAWTLYCGDIPEGMNVLHKCDNQSCVNPAHLFLGNQTDNVRDMIAKGRAGYQRRRATHCKRGHVLDHPNIRTINRRRQCLTCERDRRRNSS